MIHEFDLLTLGAPAGNGQTNDPADIAALDNSLRGINVYTPPPEYADEPQRYATEPMIRALETLQERNGLKIDGYANPGGPTERAINNRLLAKPQGAGLLWEPPAPLRARVGDGLENRREDVATVQRLLGALGHMPEDPFDRPHGLIDKPTLDATKRFQRQKGLVDDAWLAPGGETERALRDAVGDIARANGHEWLRFAERAGRAQAGLSHTLQGRRSPSDLQSEARYERFNSHADPAPDAEIVPAQSRRFPGELPAPVWPFIGVDPDDHEIVPGSPADVLRWFIESIGRYGGKRGFGLRRERLPESDTRGSRAENIPQRVPNEPHRGPDPARPPLDPKEARPAPYPAEPPYKVPDRVENIPPRRDPRENIERYPDQSDEARRMPNVHLMEDAKVFDRGKREEYMRGYREWHEREGRRIEERHERDGVKDPVWPSESYIWKNWDWHRADRGIKTNGLKGSDRRYYTYDYGGHGTHRAQIEVWDRTGKKHLGAMNPVTGEFVAPPDKTKKPIDVSYQWDTDDRDFA